MAVGLVSFICALSFASFCVYWKETGGKIFINDPYTYRCIGIQFADNDSRALHGIVIPTSTVDAPKFWFKL